MLFISTSYKLVLVCIVTILWNTVRCLDVDVPSTDFLPPYTSVETHSNNIDDDTYLTLSTTTKSTIIPTTYPTSSSTQTQPTIIKITAPTKTTLQRRTTLKPRTTLKARTTSEPANTIPTISTSLKPRTTSAPANIIPTISTSSPLKQRGSSKLHQRSSISSKSVSSSSSSTKVNEPISSSRSSQLSVRVNDASGSNSQVHQQNQDIALGIYEYHFQTDNGIQVEESGHPKDLGNGEVAEEVSGSYSYTSPEGEVISLTYTADENGFHPMGEHLPTAPPIPEAILRALKYIKEHGK